MTEKAHNTPAWRKFERLVALIETHLVPSGAIVTSPDHIQDKTTGQSREVDASIRYEVGSIPILITLECRDRTSEEDVMWIEQLIAKRESIGATATVAVSSSGFTQPALAKARSHGIETRLLREVAEEAIRDWAQKLQIVVVRGQFGLGQLRVAFKTSPNNPQPELHPDMKAEYAKGDVEYKFIKQVSDGSLLSIGDLLRDAELQAGNRLYEHINGSITLQMPPQTSASVALSQRFPSLFEGVPVNSKPTIVTRAWRFEPQEATIETEKGSTEIEYIEVDFRVIQRAYPSNIGRLLSYDTEHGPIVNVEERDIFMDDDKSIRITISGKADDVP